MHYQVSHYRFVNLVDELTKAHIPYQASTNGDEVNITIPDNKASILHFIMEKFDVMLIMRHGKSYMYLDHKNHLFKSR